MLGTEAPVQVYEQEWMRGCQEKSQTLSQAEGRLGVSESHLLSSH